MNATEEQDAKREEQRAIIADAWETLAQSKAFLTIFERDLQSHFSVFESCFNGDFNPYRAAQQDGQKSVIGHVWKQMEAAKQRIRANTPPEKPTSTIL